MLQRTERIKNNSPEHHAKLFSESKKTLEEILVKVGVTKVKSYPVTPEHKPKEQPKEQPSSMKL